MIARAKKRERRTLSQRFGDFCDQMVYAMSPLRGMGRIAARRAWEAAEKQRSERGDRAQYSGGGWESASDDRTRAERWRTSGLSPDSGLELDLETSRDHSREMYRNDSMGGTIDDRVNHVVGTGFTPQARIKEKEGVITEAEAKQFNEELEELYKRWCGKVDAEQRWSLWQQTRLAERHIDGDGEAFVVLSDMGAAEKPIPLTVEVIDPMRVETPPKHAGNPLVRMGIERDSKGGVVAYHIRKTHPGDTVNVNLEYDRIPARRVLHVFERWFAGQSRGLPWMQRTLNRVKDVKDLDESVLIAEQIRACYAAFVKSPLAPGGSRGGFGSGMGGADSRGNRMEDIEPGTLKYLGPGEEVMLGGPTYAGQYEPFQEWNYRRIAAAMNWPFEMVAKNWSGISFAGGRIVLTPVRLDCESRQQLLREMMLAAVWCRMVEEAVIVGACSIDPRKYEADPWLFHRCQWTAPRWRYSINPGEEIDADIKEIEANLATKAEKVAERGRDLEEVLEQRAKEKEMEAELGIEPPTTPGSKAPGEDQPGAAGKNKDGADAEDETADQPEMAGAGA